MSDSTRGLHTLIRDTKGQEIGFYKNSHALVIGVSEYSEGWRPLPGVNDDVEEVSAALEEHGFEVERCLNPDRDGLDRTLREFVTLGKGAEDRLLVYYAGHGYTLKPPAGVSTGYLVPVDAPLPRHDPGHFKNRSLPINQILILAREIEAKHALFVFDSCFSGALFEHENRGEPPVYINDLMLRPVRQFITSGRVDEEVPDRSVFRSHFVTALKGEADQDRDGYITAAQLADFLFRKVVTYSRDTQHPQYSKINQSELNKGDFVFRLPEHLLAGRVQEPMKSDFSIADLEAQARAVTVQQEQVLKKWKELLEAMRRAFAQAEEFERRADVVPALKRAAWDRFLATYVEKNPLSDEDEELREQATARLQSLIAAESGERAAAIGPRAGQARVETSLDIRFRYAPPGSFRMGSPESEPGRFEDETQHHVRIEHGFWIAETVVTQAQWEDVIGNDPSHFADGGEDCPVESVSWFSAVAFANELSRLAGIEPAYELVGCNGLPAGEGLKCRAVRWIGPGSQGYRLPTETEWEYAARAGTTGAFWTGDNLSTAQANYDGNFPYDGNPKGVYVERTVPVRSFQPTPWGLYEVLGNVGEWTWSVYRSYESDNESDVEIVPGREARVIRGGGWIDDAQSCRLANRLRAAPGFQDANLSFRLVRTAD